MGIVRGLLVGMSLVVESEVKIEVKLIAEWVRWTLMGDWIVDWALEVGML